MDWNGNYYFATDTLYSIDYSGNLRWALGLSGFSSGPIICDGDNIIYLPVGDYLEKYIGVDSNGNIVYEVNFDGTEFAGYSPAIGYNNEIFLPTYKSLRIFKLK
jgi:hypothetical protein